MANRDEFQMNRRKAVATGAGALAALAALTQRPSYVAASPTIQSGGGIAGGGTVTLPDGVIANFSVFASSFVIKEQDEPLINGRVQWTQDDGASFESTTISNYGPLPDVDTNARQIEGMGKVGDGTEVPFRFVLIDLDGPGSGKDVIQVMLGDPADPAFEHDGVVATGDIQLLNFDFE